MPARTLKRHFEPGRPGFLVLIAGLMSLTAMTVDINLPAIPATAADLESSVAAAQLTVSFFFLGFSIGQASWGPASDRFGRRPAMMTGLALYLATTLLCITAPSIELLLGARFVQGFAAGAGSILSRAVIRDRTSGPEMARLMSLAMAVFFIAPIVAPSIGSVLLLLAGWRVIFVFLLLYGAVMLVLAWAFLDESLAARDRHAFGVRRMAAGYAAVFAKPGSRLASLLAVVSFVPLAIYLAGAPAILLIGFGFEPFEFGLFFAATAIAAALGSLANARLVRAVRIETAILAGAVTGLGGSLVNLALIAIEGLSGWWLVLGFGLQFVGFSMVGSNAVALAMQPHGAIVGTATSALGVAQTFMPAALAAILVALSSERGVLLFSAIVIASALTLGLAMMLARLSEEG